jgi:enoyl-CoA hydratase
VSSENILVEVNSGVLALTLNRPEKLNVLDLETRKSLVNAMRAHIHDDEVRCVLISSRGEAFSAGADLRYILELTPSKARAYTRFVRSVLDFVESYPKPTIAIVDGIAVGGALELLLVLDIVIASPNAKFGLTELNVGLIPGGGGSQRLPRLVGIRKAKEMVFTGSLITAEEALSLGLVNRVVAKESLMEEARRICDRIMSKNPGG